MKNNRTNCGVVDLTADFLCRAKEKQRYNRTAIGVINHAPQIGQLLAVNGELFRSGGSYIPVYVQAEIRSYAASLNLSAKL